MRSIARVAVTFVVVQSVASGVAWACKCRGDAYDPAAVRDASEMVFVGEVLSGPHGAGCTRVSTAPVRYRLEVTEAFKGVEVGDEVEITTALQGASCGVEFAEGEEWLVYTADGTFDICDPGGLVEDVTADLEALRAD